MELQIHIGDDADPPAAHLLEPIVNKSKVEEGLHRGKPSGGFWTSSYNASSDFSAYGRGWRDTVILIAQNGFNKELCHEIWPIPYLKVWRLRPSAAAKICTVDTRKDYLNLLAKYGKFTTKYPRVNSEYKYTSSPLIEITSLNYEAIAEDYEALHLTQEGFNDNEVGGSGDRSMFNWHCESTCWFRWMFDEIEDMGHFWPDFPRQWHEQATREMKRITGMSPF
jgi:hypothetical protein